MGQLYDLRMKAEAEILRRGLNVFEVGGRIGLKAGMVWILIRPTTPDDAAQLTAFTQAVDQELGPGVVPQ